MFELIPLFSNTPTDSISELEKSASRQSYPAKTIIMTQGDEGNSMYFILSGEVSVYLTESGGKEVVLNTLFKNDYFGELSLIDGRNRIANVRTTKKSEFLILRRDLFLEFVKTHPDFSLLLLQYLTSEIRRITIQLGAFALHDVYFRIRRLLLELQEHNGNNNGLINAMINQQEIAKRVGATREMVNKIMKTLEIGGYIEYQDKKKSLLIKKLLPIEY